MVERCLRQLHGAEMAQDIIKSAAFMEEHALACSSQKRGVRTVRRGSASDSGIEFSGCRIASRSELWCLAHMDSMLMRLAGSW